MEYLKEGSPEDWLLYKNCLAMCLDRQGATGGPAKFTLARRMLMRRALADFSNAASLRTTETRDHYLQCIHAVTLGVFPQDAFKEQKTRMRCFLKKTAEMDKIVCCKGGQNQRLPASVSPKCSVMKFQEATE